MEMWGLLLPLLLGLFLLLVPRAGRFFNLEQVNNSSSIQVYDMERKNNENENKKKYGDRIKYIKNMLRY